MEEFCEVSCGAALIWLEVKKEYESARLLPMGFGAILVKLPQSGVLTRTPEVSNEDFERKPGRV